MQERKKSGRAIYSLRPVVHPLSTQNLVGDAASGSGAGAESQDSPGKLVP